MAAIFNTSGGYEDLPFDVQNRDAVGRGIEDGAVQLFTGLQFLFRLLALGDVDQHL